MCVKEKYLIWTILCDFVSILWRIGKKCWHSGVAILEGKARFFLGNTGKNWNIRGVRVMLSVTNFTSLGDGFSFYWGKFQITHRISSSFSFLWELRLHIIAYICAKESEFYYLLFFCLVGWFGCLFVVILSLSAVCVVVTRCGLLISWLL